MRELVRVDKSCHNKLLCRMARRHKHALADIEGSVQRRCVRVLNRRCDAKSSNHDAQNALFNGALSGEDVNSSQGSMIVLKRCPCCSGLVRRLDLVVAGRDRFQKFG